MATFSRWERMFILPFAVVILTACVGFTEKGGEVGPLTGGSMVGPSEQKPESAVAEVLVKFKPAVSQERIQALAEKHSTTIKEVIKDIDWYVLKIQGGRSASEVVDALKQEPEIEAVELQGLMGIQ